MSKPKIGISVRSLNRDASDIDERISEILSFSPDNIELKCYDQDLIRSGKILNERVDQIKKALKSFDGHLTMHGPLTLNLLDKRENIEFHLKLAIDYVNLGKSLGVNGIVLHTGFCELENDSSLKNKYQTQQECLKRIADISAESEIMIYVENIFPFFEGAHTALPNKLAEEIEKVNHPYVSGCFDVSHAYIACHSYGVDFILNAYQLGSLSNHWHVHDSFGRTSFSISPFTPSEALASGLGDLHLPVGDGDLPWKEIIKKVKPFGEKTFNIELNPSFWSELDRCVNSTMELSKYVQSDNEI